MSISRFPDVSGRAPERRLHHRVLVGAPAWLVLEDERHDAECVNVSMGGASVLSTARLTTGRVVTLELSLGMDHGTIAIQCEVVRSNDGEHGLRFLALDRRSLEAIVSLI